MRPSLAMPQSTSLGRRWVDDRRRPAIGLCWRAWNSRAFDPSSGRSTFRSSAGCWDRVEIWVKGPTLRSGGTSLDDCGMRWASWLHRLGSRASGINVAAASPWSSAWHPAYRLGHPPHCAHCSRDGDCPVCRTNRATCSRNRKARTAMCRGMIVTQIQG